MAEYLKTHCYWIWGAICTGIATGGMSSRQFAVFAALYFGGLALAYIAWLVWTDFARRMDAWADHEIARVTTPSSPETP